MNSLHPLLLDCAWVAGTGPIAEFNAAVTNVLRLGMPSLAVIGRPGVGKTTAAVDLFEMLAADTKVVPWQASAVGIKKDSDMPRFFRTFNRGMVSGGKAPMRLQAASDFESAFASIRLSCQEKQTQRAMLFLDEAQQLEHGTLVLLKDMLGRASDSEIHLLVLLLCDTDISAQVSRLRGRSGAQSLIERFFVSRHHYRGLNLADLIVLMDHVDLAKWPEGGPTFTEHFAPALFRGGWRLREQAEFLWAEFQQQAAGMGLEVAKFEVTPRFAVRAIRFVLSELQRDAGLVRDMGALMAKAVDSSGFAMAQQLSTMALDGPSKPTRGRPRRK